MKINSNMVLIGDKVILVPYRKEHVPVYHAWMQDPALQEATASEPLSLQEEYDMQLSWSEDNDKCTFILLDPALPDTPGTGQHGGGMAGDVNIFLNDPDSKTIAEIEVMIAEKRSRRKGLAFEALSMFMAYARYALLFDKLGYVESSRSSIFQEATLELSMTDTAKKRFHQQFKSMQINTYDDLSHLYGPHVTGPHRLS